MSLTWLCQVFDNFQQVSNQSLTSTWKLSTNRVETYLPFTNTFWNNRVGGKDKYTWSSLSKHIVIFCLVASSVILYHLMSFHDILSYHLSQIWHMMTYNVSIVIQHLWHIVHPTATHMGYKTVQIFNDSLKDWRLIFLEGPSHLKRYVLCTLYLLYVVLEWLFP
jgi:hypothetical protein